MIIDLEAMENRIAHKVAALLERSIGDDVLTLESAAELLKCHPNTLSEWAKAGHVPARRLGSSWRFRRSALLDHIWGGN